jgi:hypothetical protein
MACVPVAVRSYNVENSTLRSVLGVAMRGSNRCTRSTRRESLLPDHCRFGLHIAGELSCKFKISRGVQTLIKILN